MTDTAYQIVKKALLKKKAEVRVSPAAAKQFLLASGLGDILANAPSLKSGKSVATQKARGKKSPA
ncbi:hypothetical protein [Dinghuibacter silviterrae]|uniref:Uncharacterized protein n=1 Tax=Dinghuibacter silviterrae TaxID=1539049 RepID=A0A4R8DFL1_9BACT|nr:hypothetical protein [Dinghuibacter silviterrae]TDW96034.1 hypothetical protein EDB95_3856 [Dinghuibacter silviterrae]